MDHLVMEPVAGFRFQADWIGPELEPGYENCYFQAVREFELDEVPESALLRIAADTNYVLWLNGLKVASGPVRGTAKLCYFDTLEVAPLLRPGRNVIAVLVHSPVRENFIVAPAAPALRLEIPGVVGTGPDWKLRLAPEWKTPVPLFSLQTGFMVHRDLRLASDEWKNGVTEGWKNAAVVTDEKLCGKELKPRNVPALVETFLRPADLLNCAAVAPGDAPSLDELPVYLNREPWEPLPPGRLLQEADGGMYRIMPDPAGKGAALVFDFDRELIGRLRVVAEAPAGTVVDIVYGEELDEGRVQSEFVRPIYRFTDRYILREGENEIGTVILERGFKVVQLVFRNFGRPICIRSVGATGMRYPYVQRGRFHSSDAELNRIWEMCVETLESCTTDIFMDCPWRERAFWVNDLVVENRTTLAAFGCSAIHRRAFELAFSQQTPEGWVPGLCPQPQNENFMLPATNLFLMTMLYDYLMASGDGGTVRRYLPCMERIIEAFERLADAGGLISAPKGYWNFFDWGFELNGYRFNDCRESMINSLYVSALQCFNETAELVGYDSGKSQEYEHRRRRTAAAIEPAFLSTATGYLVDPVKRGDEDTTVSSQLAHALALLAGLERERFVAALTDETLLEPEFYLHFYVFRAMIRHGRRRAGLERIRRHWGRMARTGFPTLYEAGVYQIGRASQNRSGSLCHGFGTSPLEFLQTGILGVTAVAPGFAEFSFRPALLDLTFAEGRIPTPRGNIAVRLERSGQGIEAELRIPEGCSAVLPDGSKLETGTHLVQLEDAE